MEDAFDPDLIHAIFKFVWSTKTPERERNEEVEIVDIEVGAGTSKKNRPATVYYLNPKFHYKRWLHENQDLTLAIHEAFERLFPESTAQADFGNQLLRFRDARGTFSSALAKASTETMMPSNLNALKLSCELLRMFVTEAVQRAAIIAEAEGNVKIEATHLERILPQLLLDF